MKFIRALFAFIGLFVVAVFAACNEFIAYLQEKLSIIAGFNSKHFEKTGNYGGKGGQKNHWSYKKIAKESQEYRHFTQPDPHLFVCH